MQRAVGAFLIGASLFQPIAAGAETPDEAGAKKLAEAVRTYGPDVLAKPGLFRVSPDRDSYRLVFDTAKAIADAVAPMIVKQATPVAFGLREQPNGTWSFDASGPFSLEAEHAAADRTASLSVAAETGTFSGDFDPELLFPHKAELSLAETVLGLRDARTAVKIGIRDSRLSSELKDLSAGRGNVEATVALQDFALTQGAFPQPEVKVTAARIDGTYRAGGLDLAGIAAMVRFWQVTAAGKTVEALTDGERAEIESILARHSQPLDNFNGDIVATGLSSRTSGKGFTSDKIDYLWRWEGLTGQATLVMGAHVTNAGVDEGVWPKALEPILPKDAAVNFKASGFDMAAFWKDAAQLRTDKEIALLPRNHDIDILVPQGKIAIDVTDSYARSSFYDISVTGRFDVGLVRGKAPKGAFTITARDFDRTIKYLQDNAKAVPIFDRAAFVALMMKGLGKVGADGALVWEVRLEDTGAISVNGQPLPI